MEKTSLILFDKEYQSFQKLDYFLCSIAGALFAYIGQTYVPHKLDNWYHWLMPLALLCLTVSFLCGLRRMQHINLGLEANRKAHFAAEQSGVFFDILVEFKKNPNYEVSDRSTRKQLTHKDALQRKLEWETEQSVNNAKCKAAEKIVDRFGFVRTSFLVLGFLLILASKVLQPYYEK
jgi:hypothetical protein